MYQHFDGCTYLLVLVGVYKWFVATVCFYKVIASMVTSDIVEAKCVNNVNKPVDKQMKN